jgi:hypothetical protein
MCDCIFHLRASIIPVQRGRGFEKSELLISIEKNILTKTRQSKRVFESNYHWAYGKLPFYFSVTVEANYNVITWYRPKGKT